MVCRAVERNDRLQVDFVFLPVGEAGFYFHASYILLVSNIVKRGDTINNVANSPPDSVVRRAAFVSVKEKNGGEKKVYRL